MELLRIGAHSSIQSALRERAARALVVILLILSIIFPATIQSVKTLLLVVIVIAVLIGLLTSRNALSWRLYSVSCIYAFFGLVWSLYGEMRATPGAVKVMTVMVFYPLVIPLCASLYREQDNDSLYNIFIVCTWIIVATDIVYTLAYSTYAGQLLQNMFNHLYTGDLGDVLVVNTETYIKRFRLPNLNSILFLLPFFISALFFPKRGRSRIHILLIVLSALLLAVIAGRRGLLVSMIVGPAIAFLLTIHRSRNRIKNKEASSWWMFIIALTISICLYFVFQWAGIADSLRFLNSIFNFTDNESNLERVYQFHSLMRGIYDNPIFGQGAGAAADYIRSNEMPWAYELSYVAIIFQYGLIGFVVYAVGVVFLCWHLISAVKKKGRSSFEFYCLSAFIAFMIANATNPYIFEFDSMWILFIPYAIANRKCVIQPSKIGILFSCSEQRFDSIQRVDSEGISISPSQ